MNHEGFGTRGPSNVAQGCVVQRGQSITTTLRGPCAAACPTPFAAPFELFAMSSEPLDRDTLFKKLRSKPENKVGCPSCLVLKDSISTASPSASLVLVRSVLIARPRTPPGPRCPMVCTYAWPVPASTAAWACTSASSGRASSTALPGQAPRVLQAAWGWSFSLPPLTCVCLHRSTTLDTWTEDQLRVRQQYQQRASRTCQQRVTCKQRACSRTVVCGLIQSTHTVCGCS